MHGYTEGMHHGLWLSLDKEIKFSLNKQLNYTDTSVTDPRLYKTDDRIF